MARAGLADLFHQSHSSLSHSPGQMFPSRRSDGSGFVVRWRFVLVFIIAAWTNTID